MRVTLALLVQAVVVAASPQPASESPRDAPRTRPFDSAQAGRALEAYARGDYATVLSLLEAPYKAGEASLQHRLILARAQLHLGRGDEALAVLKSVLADDRENGEANSLAGRILLDADKSKQALDYLRQAYRLKRNAATASDLGRCYHALGEVTKAKPLLAEAAEKDIRNPDNSLLLGRICLERGMGALAERHLLAAQEAGLDSPELHLLLLRAYLLQHKFIGPVSVRRIAPPPEPGGTVPEGLVLGPVAGAGGQYRIATRFCALYEGHQLLKLRPGHADGLYAAARGWFAAGEIDRAVDHLDRLAAGEPDSRRVLELRARVLIVRQDSRGLREHLGRRAAQEAFSAAELGEFYYQAALVLRGLGRREEALAILAEAERSVPTSGKVLRSLGALHLAMGNRKPAADYYARMVELFPDAEDIHELRNTLKVLGGSPDEEPSDEKGRDAPDEPPFGAEEVPRAVPGPEVEVEFE